MAKETKEFWDDMNWAEEHYSELMQKYPDKWVAVVDKKIQAAGVSIKKIKEEAEKKTHRDKDQIPVIFIECGSHIY